MPQIVYASKFIADFERIYAFSAEKTAPVTQHLAKFRQKSIKDAVALHGGCSVEFEYDEYWFTTIFYRKTTPQPDNVTDKNEIATAKRTNVILELIANNPNISTSELATQLEVSKRTVLRDINILKQQNKLERIGKEKTGYWKIND